MDIKEISLEVYNALKNDETLSAYVKRFDRSIGRTPGKIFPYIAVGKISCMLEPETIGRRGYIKKNYTMNIVGGTYSLVPEIAYAGKADGSSKGVLQLSADIVSAVYPGTINGTFDRCIDISDVSIATREKSSGNFWHCLVVLKGVRRELSGRNAV